MAMTTFFSVCFTMCSTVQLAQMLHADRVNAIKSTKIEFFKLSQSFNVNTELV